MNAENPTAERVGKAVATNWLPAGQDPQVYVDEASLSYIGDRIYLTLGQIQAPAPGHVAREIVDIQPMARVVMTETAFHKIVSLLNQVKDQIPTPPFLKGKSVAKPWLPPS